MTGEAPWTSIDFVTATLSAATLVLTGVALIVAIGAWWGYRDLKAATLAAAEKEAQRVALEVAERQIGAYLEKIGQPEQSEPPDVSTGYRDSPP